MFGGCTALCDADLVDGSTSLMEYATRILADLLNAAALFEHAERAVDEAHLDTKELFTLALRNFLDVAGEGATRARRARLVGLGTDGIYASGYDCAEDGDQLEGDIGGALVEEARLAAEHVAAQAIAKRPDLWYAVLWPHDLLLSVAPNASAPAPAGAA